MNDFFDYEEYKRRQEEYWKDEAQITEMLALGLDPENVQDFDMFEEFQDSDFENFGDFVNSL